MSKSDHNFNKSQETETKYAHIHNKVYELHTKAINKKYSKNLTSEIDREVCNYNTELGKSYQQADTDAIISLTCGITNVSAIKKVSEKTRNRYYDDIYIEVVSVFKLNPVTKKYEFQAPGWGIKNEKNGPDCLSMLFIDENKQQYYSLFISKYKKLKEDLFNDSFLNNMKNGKIENWLNKYIQEDRNKGQKSFRREMKGETKSNVKEIVFAKNNGYFTVGFTFSMSHIKSLVFVNEYRGSIVDQKPVSMQY